MLMKWISLFIIQTKFDTSLIQQEFLTALFKGESYGGYGFNTTDRNSYVFQLRCRIRGLPTFCGPLEELESGTLEVIIG